jgi:hypothetical protein
MIFMKRWHGKGGEACASPPVIKQVSATVLNQLKELLEALHAAIL